MTYLSETLVALVTLIRIPVARRCSSKEELSKVAQSVQGLTDFLSLKDAEQIDKEDSMAAMLASLD